MNPASSMHGGATFKGIVRETGLKAACATLLLAAAPLFAFAAAHHYKAPPIPKPYAAFDYNPLTSLKANPTITGTASSSAPFHLKVTGSRGVVFDDPAVWIYKGRFSETVYPPIPNGVYRVSLYAGSSTIATSTLTIGLRAWPSVGLDTSLMMSGIDDGHLMRFSIRARGPSGIGISQLSFSVLPYNAVVTDLYLYGYTDPNFTNPIVASSTDPLQLAPSEITATSSVITVVPDAPIEIPGNTTYYFDLVGTVASLDTPYNVETTLLGDSNAYFAAATDLASTSHFIWSPNTYGTTSLDARDWTNGAFIEGIPRSGLISVRTNTPSPDAPVCNMYASTSTAAGGTPVVFTWSSTGAASAIWDSGAKEATAGSKTYIQGTSTQTRILNFYGPYGFTSCYATVASPYAAALAATAMATTTLGDGFTATPTAGAVTLSVKFTGSVNNAKLCTSQTYSFGYGDGATTTISVGANSCKPQSFSLSHNYGRAGAFAAGLYKGPGTSTAQLIQSQVITVKSKTAISNAATNAAAVLFAAGSGFWQALQSLLNIVGL